MKYRYLDKTKAMRRDDWSMNKKSFLLKDGLFFDIGTKDSTLGLDFNDAIADDWINTDEVENDRHD